MLAYFYILICIIPITVNCDKPNNIPGRSVLLIGTPSRDIVRLTASNLTIALNDFNAWVLVIGNSVPLPILEEATNYRGLIKFGFVNRRDNETIEKLKFDANQNQYRALSFGNGTAKTSFDSYTFADALNYASKSITSDPIIPLNSASDIELLATDCATSNPTRIAVIFLILDKTPTLLQRTLSHKLQRYFKFGLITSAKSEGKLQKMNLASEDPNFEPSVPGILTLIITEGKKGEPKVASTPYDEETNGDVNFVNVFRFLVELNRSVRHELIGHRHATNKEVLLMSDVLKLEEGTFQIVDLAAKQYQPKDEL